MATQPKKPGGGTSEGSRSQRPWRWWPILAALLIWDLILFWPRSHPEVNIPYSTFLAQVRADNVVSVHIVGAAITGAFGKPILWPEPKPTTASKPGIAPKPVTTPKPESSASPSAKPQQHTAPSQRFAQFETTFPATVGDPGLMPILESHHVVVEVSPTTTPLLLEILLD
ncbi:MAG: ATP-dependent metallopeptidase FtsH/Yme1/Tma family protein, partial [Candidatus Binataceae bacterium]